MIATILVCVTELRYVCLSFAASCCDVWLLQVRKKECINRLCKCCAFKAAFQSMILNVLVSNKILLIIEKPCYFCDCSVDGVVAVSECSKSSLQIIATA